MVNLALDVLQRVELKLLSSPKPELAVQVTDLILLYQGVQIETPPSPAEIYRICEELLVVAPRTDEQYAQLAQDIAGGKNLLIELVKRTAFDWVLYRNSRKMDYRRIAEDAYIWLFLENEEHYHWQVRESDGKSLTSFQSICDVLDMDAERIRAKVRTLTPEKVRSSGRPPAHARNEVYDAHVSVHASLPSEEAEEVDIGSFF